MNNYFKKSLLMILGGVAALVVALVITISGQKQLARDTEPATATVTDYFEDEQTDADHSSTSIMYFPIVTYEVDGNTIESQYTIGQGDKDYEIGSTIDIKYDPDNPEEFIIVGDSSITSFPRWVILAGGVLLILGIGRIVVPVIGSMKK